MARAVSPLLVDDYGPTALARLVAGAPREAAVLTDEHRRSLSARLRAVPDPSHRRLDAWGVENAAGAERAFSWTPAAARRSLATAALVRAMASPGTPLVGAVSDVVDAQRARAATGQTRHGSLAQWLDTLGAPELGLVVAEATSWAVTTQEAALGITDPWSIPASDLYYDVAGARTTLRGRRDIEVTRGDERVVVRLRAGAPGPSAGAGLRVDLVVAALADFDGVAPARLIGLWPEAGVVLGVDGAMQDLRRGARDLVRAAVVTLRRRLVLAA